jgi:hypothetical protein
MRKIHPDDGLVELAEAIILQAVEDYVHLSEKKIIRGREVDVSAWARRTFGHRGYCKPLGYASASEALELISWLAGNGLEYLCNLTNHHACRIRKRIGMVPSSVAPLTMVELDRFHRASATFKMWEHRKTEAPDEGGAL